MNFEDIFGGFNVNSYEVEFQVYIGNQLVQRSPLRAPRQIIEMKYLGTLQQILQESQPMSLKMIMKHDVYDDNDNYVRTLNNYIESSNYKREYED